MKWRRAKNTSVLFWISCPVWRRSPGGRWYEVKEFILLGHEISGALWILLFVWIFDRTLYDLAAFFARNMENDGCFHPHFF